MSSPPTKYLRYFDFTTFATLNPEKPLPGGSVDVEFNRVKSTTDQTIDRLALIQRDDGGLRDGLVTSSAIADGAITTPKLADGAVTTPKIADAAVTGPKIAPGSLTGAALAPGSIGSVQLADGGVATVDLADGAVTGQKLAPLSVATTHIQDNAVTLPKLADLSVSTLKLVDLSVTTPKLADLAVTTAKIGDAQVTAAKIAPGAITGSQIPDGSVAGAKLVPGSIGTVQLADGGVTLAKLAPNSVDSSKIVDGTIAPADLSASTLALITSAGNPRGPWVTATNYAAKDSVTMGSGVFIALAAHVSGVFADDLAAGKWMQTGQIFDQSLNKADGPQFAKLGVGMVPVNVLDITQSVNANAAIKLLNPNVGNAALAQLYLANAGAGYTALSQIGAGFAGAGMVRADGTILVGAGAGGLSLLTGAAQPIYFGINAVEKMRLDANGNLGVGRIPNAFGAAYNYFALGSSAGLFAPVGVGSGDLALASNTYYDGADHRAITASASVLQYLSGGQTFWMTAPVVAAGGVANFTERLRLDNNGNLGIGMVPVNVLDITRNVAGGASIKVLNNNAGATSYAALQLDNGTSIVQLLQFGAGFAASGMNIANRTMLYTNGAGGLALNTGLAAPIIFGIGGAERMRLDNNGQLYNAPTRGSKRHAVQGGVAANSQITIFKWAWEASNLSTGVRVKVTAVNDGGDSGYCSVYREVIGNYSCYAGAQRYAGMSGIVTLQQSVNAGVIGINVNIALVESPPGFYNLTVQPISSGATGFSTARITASMELIGVDDYAAIQTF